MRPPCLCAAAVSAVAAIGSVNDAHAQSSPFLQGEIPFEYSRGRNTSVLERPRPEYATPGIVVGGFTLRPTLDTAVNATDNVYSLPEDKTGDANVTVAPSARVASNWSRHRLAVDVGGRFRRYMSETLQNEDGWFARAAGRVELGLDTKIDISARAEQLYETRFSTSSINNIASAVPYRLNEGNLMVQDTRGRVRIAGSANYTSFDFGPVTLFNGNLQSQDNRDREILTGAALVEYGISASTAVFSQISYEKVDYGTELSTGLPNRNSNTVRVLAGTSLDITALVRGRIGAGYTVRDYDSNIYNNVKGLSLEVQLEYFPSELTTVGLFVRRRADDAATIRGSGYLGTTSTLRVDHELLRNLILTGRLDYEQGSYKGTDSAVEVFRLGSSARYLFSPNISFGLNLDYGRRDTDGTPVGPSFTETRGGVSMQLRL